MPKPSRVHEGSVFGKLTVISLVGSFKGHRHWKVKCQCGDEKEMLSENISAAKSCGCVRNTPRRKIISYLQVAQLYLAGMSTRKIAKTLGNSESWIAQIVKKLGISRDRSEALILACPAKSSHWRTTRSVARRKMERHLKRKLKREEHVHHINHDHTDNRIENLTVINAGDHSRHHHPKNPTPRHLRPERQAYMRNYLKTYRRRNG